MLHLFKSAASKATTYGLIALLLVGLLIGAVRLALPFADLFRSELEGTLSETLGLQVQVGRLGVRLAGHAPQLILQDAELLDPENGLPRLSLEQLRIDLNLGASVRERAPQIEAVTLVGARLVIKRLKNGAIMIAGLEGMEGGEPEGMRFFFGNGRFLLADSDLYWIDEKSGAPPLHLSDVQIDFANTGDRHRIGVLAQLFDDRQTHLRLVGDMRGKPGRPANWRGEIYLHWRGKSLDQLFEGRLPPDLLLGSDSVEIESWNDLEGEVVTQSLNRIAIKGLVVGGESEGEAAAPLLLDEVGGLLRWRRVGDGWRLDVNDLALTRGGTRRPVSDLMVGFFADDDDDDDGGWTIEGGNEALDLADARDLLAQLPLPRPGGFGLLSAIHPGGQLLDLRFRFRHRPELPPRWSASARIANLSLDAHADLPGLAGLAAELVANQRQGRLSLSADDLNLQHPDLFPETIGLDEVAGEIHWRQTEGGTLQVRAQEIVAGSADITTRSRLAISLPPGGGSPFLDLHTEFQDLGVAAARRYIPMKRLPKKLASWLDRALVGGRIPSGGVLFRGAIGDFPFAEHQGRFIAQFGVEETTLDFNPDWPRLEALEGDVRFENSKMEIFLSDGRFMDSEIADVSIGIPDLREAVAVEVQGTVEGPFSDDLRVLGETPLRDRLGALAETFEAEGLAHLDLDMAIPLRHKGHKGPLRVAGELTWPGAAALAIADRDIKLTQLAGKLRFTERSIEAQSIEAKLWKMPLRLSIDSRRSRGDPGASTRIRARGQFPAPVLAKRFPAEAWKLLRGQARLDLRLDVGGADMGKSMPPIDFELSSDLAGLAVELPAPLGKTAETTKPLRLSGRLAAKKALRIEGGYGDLGINLGLAKVGAGGIRLARGTFNFSGDAVPLPKAEGLYLSGSIPNLDLQVWLNWWEKREGTVEGNPGKGSRLRSADVRVDRLVLSDTALNELRLQLQNGSDRWEVKLGARELAGTVTAPHRPRSEPIRVRLQRLDLKGVLNDKGEKGQARAGERKSDPRQMHTLDLGIDDLLWGENSLGQVTLRSQAAADGLDFTDLALAGPFMKIQGNGHWIQTQDGPRTNLVLTAKGADLGKFLSSLEFKSSFNRAPAVLEFELAWPGGPTQLSAADLQGRIGIELEAGSLVEVEPGVGRMLGILNFEALQRRLALDFSDLFDRGYAFENISGEVVLGQGEARIEKLVIEGPSADISIAGSANLVDQEFNQVVTVTPRLGTGVAIASAVAGGPLVGAAVFLADQVSGGAVDKLGRHQYHLTGPWAAPKISRGKLGADDEAETAQEHFLPNSRRTGAEESRGPKPEQAGAKIPVEAATGKPRERPAPPEPDGDENLFLKGH